MFQSPLFIPFFLFALGAMQFAVAGLVAWQRRLDDWPQRIFFFYVGLIAIWEWIVGLSPWLAPVLYGGLALLVAMALIIEGLIGFYLTWAFLHRTGRKWIWVATSLLGLVPSIGLYIWRPEIPATLPISLPNLAIGVAAFVWVIYCGVSAIFTLDAYRQATRPLHRNRVSYWFLGLGLIVMTGLTFIISDPILGGPLRLFTTVALAYILTNHRLPDLRANANKAGWYILVGFASAFIYVIVIFLVENGLQTAFHFDQYQALWGTFLVVAILVHPLVQLLQRMGLQFGLGTNYDSAETVRDYSASIANILNIDRLAQQVSRLMADTMDADNVHLWLVDYIKFDNQLAYRLQTIPLSETETVINGTLSPDNPVAQYLSLNEQPLAQYDIDLLPRYRGMPADEKQWLSDLHNDVYVPILARGQWIGLLTLGPKSNGDRYFDGDMRLLNTLADQTAIALENARLVTDLVNLNKELKQAFADLEKAHQQLNELDRLKSAFIGAITHELRTPISSIQFSIQLIEKYGIESFIPEQKIQFQELVEETRQAKVMVDNLVNFATFLGKQGELKLADFDFLEMVKTTLVMLEPIARRKSIKLSLESGENLSPVHGDQARLSDAVYHLIHNAIKFTEPNGDVTVRCEALGDYLVFEVTDSGVGVPPDKLDSLWENFNQMADPLKRGLEGLGLGLALVKYVVTAHDGDTAADSTGVPGEGSTFGFRIPFAGPKPPVTVGVNIMLDEAGIPADPKSLASN